MAIQIRRGLQADFDPSKMLPGEWAVSIDTDSSKQVVWMCFSPGVVKPMATITDMLDQIAAATDDIKQQYITAFNIILDEIEAKRIEVAENTVFVGNFKTLLENTYIPGIEQDVTDAANSASAASASKAAAAGSATTATQQATLAASLTHGGTGTRPGEDTDNAEHYKNQAKEIAGITTIINDTTASANQTYSSNKIEEIKSELNSDLSAKATTAIYTATITTTWTGSAAPYTQDITLTGILATDTPVIDVLLSDTLATAQAQEKAWNYVSRIKTSANKISVICNKTKPTTEIPIQIKVVR